MIIILPARRHFQELFQYSVRLFVNLQLPQYIYFCRLYLQLYFHFLIPLQNIFQEPKLYCLHLSSCRDCQALYKIRILTLSVTFLLQFFQPEGLILIYDRIHNHLRIKQGLHFAHLLNL